MVNLLGTAAVVRAALPYLKATQGKVVTVASTLGHRAFPDATAYCASKFGVVGFTRALQSELKGEVGVTLLIPGGMQTAFFDDRDEQYKPGPDAKLNRPEDVAASVLFVLAQPPGCEVRELVIASAWEGSLAVAQRPSSSCAPWGSATCSPRSRRCAGPARGPGRAAGSCSPPRPRSRRWRC